MAGLATLRRRGRRNRRPWFDWLVVPTLVVLAGVVGYPVYESIRLSFTRYRQLTGLPAHFIGAQNYDQLAHDSLFWQSLLTTIIYTFGAVLASALIGAVLALLTENLIGRWRIVRSLLLTPWAVPIIVSAFLFRYMFENTDGVVNGLLMDLHLTDHKVEWLTSGHWALFTVTLANVWTQIPFFLLMFTAALAAVPKEVVEAGLVDRAGTWALIRYIKLPYLRGAAVVGGLIMVISNFNDFSKIWSMTEGGPAYSTTTLVVYVYRIAFTRFNLGYASTVGVVWLVLLILFAVVYVRLAQRNA